MIKLFLVLLACLCVNLGQAKPLARRARARGYGSTNTTCATNAECLQQRGTPIKPQYLYGTKTRRSGVSPVAPTTFSYSARPATYTVPSTGLYTIKAIGAGGGSGQASSYQNSYAYAGGLGASATGTGIPLTSGTVLQIVVGGTGVTGHISGGGGGGGSYVYTGANFLVVGGGGGGGSWSEGVAGGTGYYGLGNNAPQPPDPNNSGGDGTTSGDIEYEPPGSGGTQGGGGSGGDGTGGAGVLANGEQSQLGYGSGGNSPANGAGGGNADIPSTGAPGMGGFGGGGGAGYFGGGGGGGYSGGGAGGEYTPPPGYYTYGTGGGGGSSFVTGTAGIATYSQASSNSNGEVVITST